MAMSDSEYRRFRVLPPGCLIPAYDKRCAPTGTILMTRKPCIWDDVRKQVTGFWAHETNWDDFDVKTMADWLLYLSETFPLDGHETRASKYKPTKRRLQMDHKKVSRMGTWHIGAYWGASLEQVWPPASPEDKKSRHRILREIAEARVPWSFGSL